MATEDFTPDWTNPPGSTVSDLLVWRGMGSDDLAVQLGYSASAINQLLVGEMKLTTAVAQKLERLFGPPARFWTTREEQYRQDLVRLGITSVEHDPPESELEAWGDSFPVKDMEKFGWLSALEGIDVPAKMLSFFGVRDPQQWRQRYEPQLAMTVFRTSAHFESEEAAVLAWLRKAELEASAQGYANWNRDLFVAALPEIRELTPKTPAEFFPKLQEICGRCGVVVVVLRAPLGCRASGASFFTESGQAVIALSNRHRTDDRFWFNFFHEAGHLVLHSEGSLFLEFEDSQGQPAESEANAFAANILLPPDKVSQLPKLARARQMAVARFARSAGVSPGIVVGQMQHRKIIGYERMNKLKRSFQWSDFEI